MNESIVTKEEAIEAGHVLLRLEEEATKCPYDTFRKLRAVAPVQWFEEINAFAVTQYEAIVEILKAPTDFSSRHPLGPLMEARFTEAMGALIAERADVGEAIMRTAKYLAVPVLLTTDPPVHGRQRSLVNRAFSPSAIKRLVPDIERLADEFIDAFVKAGEVELVSQYSVPIPVTVIANALGIPLERKDDFKRWSDAVSGSVGNHTLDREQMVANALCRAEMDAFLEQMIEERTTNPDDDLISTILAARIDGEALSRPEVVQMVEQFLVAGNDTTTRLIAAAVLKLAVDPDLAERLRRNSEEIPGFVEECLRYYPPVNGIFREAIADCEIGGVPIPAGSHLWLVYASGNRDASDFEDPEEFIHDRPHGAPHLAFGLGEHFCLGAALARAEARIAIERLLNRCNNIRLSVSEDVLEYDTSYAVHGLKELPLTFDAA